MHYLRNLFPFVSLLFPMIQPRDFISFSKASRRLRSAAAASGPGLRGRWWQKVTRQIKETRGEERRGERGKGFSSTRSFRSRSLFRLQSVSSPLPSPPRPFRDCLFLSLFLSVSLSRALLSVEPPTLLYRRVSADRLLIPDARVMFFY